MLQNVIFKIFEILIFIMFEVSFTPFSNFLHRKANSFSLIKRSLANHHLIHTNLTNYGGERGQEMEDKNMRDVQKLKELTVEMQCQFTV